LRERLSDAVFSGDLQRIVADSVMLSEETVDDRAEHFFEVRLDDIARLRNDALLNEQQIANHLMQVAPLAFDADFSFAQEIEKRLAELGRSPPIDLTVAGETVRRPYKDELPFPNAAHTLCIKDIEFVEFADVDGGAGAVRLDWSPRLCTQLGNPPLPDSTVRHV